ncbi:MAG: hypothetical protein ACP5KI_06235 [Brevinematia bacterium]
MKILKLTLLPILICNISYGFIVIDGIKDNAWINPIASSEGEGYNNDPCKYIYVTNDSYYIYFLFWYQGDQNSSDGLSSHNIIAIDTKQGGGNYDPWQNNTTFSDKLPDYMLMSYHNAQNGLFDILVAIWENNKWTTIGSLNRFDYKVNINGISEIKIPLNELNVKTGDTINIVQYYRYNQNAPGISDSTPYNQSSSLNSQNSALISNFAKYTIVGEKYKTKLIKPIKTVLENEDIKFYLTSTGNYYFKIRNLSGTLVADLGNVYLNQGELHSLQVRNLKRGIYLLEVSYGEIKEFVKFLVK